MFAMKKLYVVIFSLLLAVLICGCSQAPNLAINSFDLTPGQSAVTVSEKDKKQYFNLENSDYQVGAALYEYEGVVVLLITIENKTDQDIEADGYSVSLADGRGLTPLKMLKREDLIAAKEQYGGGKEHHMIPGMVSPQTQLEITLITNAVNVAMNSTNIETKTKMINLINEGINDYFIFSIIPAKAQRSGDLSFVSGTKLEYPLTLTVTIKGQPFTIKFMPKKK